MTAWCWRPTKRCIGLLVLLAWVMPAQAEGLPRERFDAGVERLRDRFEAIARSAKGVHGNEIYLVEVVTRQTGDYVAVIIRALSNDPQTFEVCQSARRHFLRQLTGVGTSDGLAPAVARILDGLFFPELEDVARKPDPAVEDLAQKVSLTMVLSWRKCSGWIDAWDALE